MRVTRIVCTVDAPYLSRGDRTSLCDAVTMSGHRGWVARLPDLY